MIPPANAVKLRPVAPPSGADPLYIARYYAAVGNLSVALTWYTPAEARYILAHRNTRNRPMRASWRLIREKINAYLFQVNGETAIYDTEGTVMSAQHRLRAIAEGTHPVSILSVYGVDPAAFSTLDQGSRRSGSDVLSLVGKSNATLLASALTWAMRHAGSGLDRGNWQALSNERVEEIAAAYPTMDRSVLWAKSKKTAKAAPLGLLAFMHNAFHECDPVAAPAFFEKVVDGIGVPRLSWERALRNRIEKDFQAMRSHAEHIHLAALFIKAFNYSRAGRPIIPTFRGGKEIAITIIWKHEGKEPFPELRPAHELALLMSEEDTVLAD